MRNYTQFAVAAAAFATLGAMLGFTGSGVLTGSFLSIENSDGEGVVRATSDQLGNGIFTVFDWQGEQAFTIKGGQVESEALASFVDQRMNKAKQREGKGGVQPDSPPRWEYARWTESAEMSVWISRSDELYHGSKYETYKALGGTKTRAEFTQRSRIDAMLDFLGGQGWELCGVMQAGGNVYIFKKPRR